MILVKIEFIVIFNKGKVCFVMIIFVNVVIKIFIVDKVNVINRLCFVIGLFLIFNCMV